MSGSYCDDKYTFVPKPTASYTVVEKPTATHTVVPTPCLELLGILTEDSIEILYEDTRVMVREG